MLLLFKIHHITSYCIKKWGMVVKEHSEVVIDEEISDE